MDLQQALQKRRLVLAHLADDISCLDRENGLHFFSDIERYIYCKFYTGHQYLPTTTLDYVAKVAGRRWYMYLHRCWNNNSIYWKSSPTDFRVQDITTFVVKVCLTQTFKQELFAKTIPNYSPPSKKERLQTIFDANINHITENQAGFLLSSLPRYYHVHQEYDPEQEEDEYDDYGPRLLYSYYPFDELFLHFENVGKISPCILKMDI